MKSLFTLALICTSAIYCNAQVIKCFDIGTVNAKNLNLNTKQNLATHYKKAEKIQIPVVVHVIHDGITNPNISPPLLYEDNIPQEDIIRQIEILNQDFSRTNPDRNQTINEFQSIAAGLNVEFVLAEIDPDGNPTNGIDRVLYPGLAHTGFVVNQEIETIIKPLTVWNPDEYLNIWTIRFAETTSTFALLGYAQFPDSSGLAGMPSDASTQNPNTDGVVINPIVFGVSPENDFFNNNNRTLTHEIGHLFGLRHIWGDGNCNVDDFVNDTPNAESPSAGCQLDRFSCDGLNQVQNYMDYSNGVCQNIFTQGQVARMQIVLNKSPRRRQLKDSKGINRSITSVNNIELPNISLYPNPSSGKLSYNTNLGLLNYSIINSSGKVVQKGISTGIIEFIQLENGLYFIQIEGYKTQKISIIK